MDHDELVDEVLRLTLLWQQGESDDESRAQLERMLADSEEARRVYLSVVTDTVSLTEIGEALHGGLEDDDAMPTIATTPLTASVRHGFVHWIARHPWLGMTLTTCLAIVALGVAAWQTMEREKGRAVARIINMEDVRWSESGHEFQVWEGVTAGQTLAFDSGMIELVVDDGVQLVLRGPCHVHFRSAQHIVAKYGNMVARVGMHAQGFVVETPQAVVTDLGTSFGLAIASDASTEVVVYEGIVDLNISLPTGILAKRLQTGEALRVDADGNTNRITMVQENRYLSPPTLHSVSFRRTPVITSVKDNIESHETAKYYRIVAGGLQEDHAAYVDRLHQFNGIDGLGMPACLRGADLVMTFNDDKVRNDLQIDVEVSQPAALYVLMDDRVEPPGWLRDAFVDTGLDVGLDEGFADPGTSRVTAEGPGNSIDRVFSIWKKEVRQAGMIRLGAVSDVAPAQNPRAVGTCMYGIAAQPLENPGSGSIE